MPSELKGCTEDRLRKRRQAYDGIDNMFRLAKRIGVAKIAFGTDIITDPELLKRGNEEIMKDSRTYENRLR